MPLLADAAGSRSSRPSRAPRSRPAARRQIDVLYLTYLEKQVDPALLKKITARANAIEKAFNVYRAKVDGKEMTDSEVRKVLKESKDSGRRKAVWEASKGVGQIVGGRPEGAGQAAQPGGHADSASRTSTRCSFISTSRARTR